MLLEEVRRRYRDTAVIMLSAVSDVQIAVDCLKQGALDYIAKPMVLGEVQLRVTRALEKRELTLQNRFYQQHLEEEVRRQRARIQELFLEGAQTLAHALEAKDAYTRGHSQRVREYAVRTAVHARLHRRLPRQPPPRRRAARHRQDRHPGGDPEQAGPPHARRIPPHHRAYGPRRAHPGAAGAGPPGGAPHRALASRATRRRRLPRRAQGRRHPGRGADRGGGGRLRRDDDQPCVP